MTPEERRNELRRRQLAARVRSAQEPKPRTFGQTLKENLLGDNDPTTQNFGERVGSVLNKAGEAMTLGLIGDEASAAVESLAPGVDYEDRRDHYRQQEEILEQERPGLSLAADIGGGLAMPLGALGALRNAGPLAQMLGSGALTGAMSGTYGFMEGEGGAQNRLEDGATDAAIGAGIGAAIPVVGGVVKKGADAVMRGRAIRNAARGAPTTEQLHGMARQLYSKLDDAGVEVKPESFRRLVDQLRTRLRDAGLDELPGPGSLTPKAARAMQIADEMVQEMANDQTAALPFSSLDQLRRHAGTAARNMSPDATTDRALGAQMISEIDDYIKSIGADDVVAGDVQTLQEVLPKARDMWARMSRSRLVDDAMEVGEDAYLSGSGTGIKQQFKRILKNPKLSRGFSDAERKVMSRVVNGSIPEQILRFAGSGLTHIFGPMAGFGLAGGGVPGAIAGLGTLGASRLAREGSDALIRRNAEMARRIVAKGGLDAFPQLSPARRRLIEQLMRQTGVAVQQ